MVYAIHPVVWYAKACCKSGQLPSCSGLQDPGTDGNRDTSQNWIDFLEAELRKTKGP